MEQEQDGVCDGDGYVCGDPRRGNAGDQEVLRSRPRVPQALQALVLPLVLEQHQQRQERSTLPGEAGTFSR